MTTTSSIRPAHGSVRRGLSLVEAAVSTVLVGVLLVAALGTVGASRSGQQKVSLRRQGHLLAQSLMSEILRQSYADPGSGTGNLTLRDFGGGPQLEPVGPGPLGPEPGEADGTRAAFDDVDDYDGWSASPPSNGNGTPIPDTAGWQRSVSVTFVDPLTRQKDMTADRGAKMITVTVTYDDAPVAELVALRTVGLPPPQEGPTVLFVVTDVASPTDQELARSTLMESWGFAVTLIAAADLQESFDAAVANADVAYVSEEIDDAALGTKLRDATIGVVNEEAELADELGFVQLMGYGTRDAVQVADNTHYITSPFALGPLTLFSSSQPVHWTNGPWAPDLRTLAETNSSGSDYEPSLAILEPGDALWDVGTAAGRRVQMPWGDEAFDFSALNDDARTIMKRAIEWAAGMEEGAPACGDGTCDAGEGRCICSDDCGAPPAFEEPGLTCDDGTDNDCDGDTDCDDLNCFADPACVVCGNGVCEPGEDCNSCLQDCPGNTSGKPADQYCCGDGVLQAAEGDGSICDGNP